MHDRRGPQNQNPEKSLRSETGDVVILLLLYSQARTTSTGFEFKSSKPTTTPTDTRVGCKRTTRPKITTTDSTLHPPSYPVYASIDDHYRILPEGGRPYT